MKEVGSLVLAAGLAISGCDCRKPKAQCEALQTRLMGQYGNNEKVELYCDKIDEKASKEFCLNLRDELHRAFMQLCLTSKTRFPHSCTRNGGKIVCKPAELKIEKDSK